MQAFRSSKSPGIRHQNSGFSVQPKLEIGRANDKYEQQADAVADRVMRMPMPSSRDLLMRPYTQKTDIQMKCAKCEEEEKLQMKPVANGILQMKPGNGGIMASDALSGRLNGTKGTGQPLPEKVKNEMSSKIGVDFNGVKVHTDHAAIQMNREIGAQAFTHGSDIYFNQGKYNPENLAGRHLLAHELTHVVQQNSMKIQRSLLQSGDECEERGPANREIDEDHPESGLPPLIWNSPQWLEKKRKKRPTVGHAQELLNVFLRNYDDEGSVYMAKSVETDMYRSGIPKQLNVDCWFGPKTEKAAILFQQVFQLAPDGKIGSQTWPMLEKMNDVNTLPVCIYQPVEKDQAFQLAAFGSPTAFPCQTPTGTTAPEIAFWSYQNSGKLSFDNCCSLCNSKVKLGLDSKYYDQFGMVSYVNGIETKAFIRNHINGASYDMKRIVESAMWEGDGQVWKLLPKSYSSPGTLDDSNDQDECLTPQQIASDTLPYIYQMDHPGFTSINVHGFDPAVTDVVFKGTFEEWIDITMPGGGTVQDAKVFTWHAIVWLNLINKKVVFNTSKSKIEKGTVSVGKSGP